MPNTHEIRIYRFLIGLLSPVLWLWLLREAWQYKTFAWFHQRLGNIPTIQADHWIHCASVGEVNAVMPLVFALRDQGKRIHITTFTPTGLAQVERRLGKDTHISASLLSIDWQWSIQRQLKQIQTPELWLVETELWVNLILLAKQQGRTIRLINARTTEKTRHRALWWRRLLVQLLDTQIDQILTRNAQDIADFRSLGVTGSHLHVIGNVKWCDHLPATLHQWLDQPYLVFASTHEPEEIELARRWQQHPELPVLVIVPRHPKRGDQIAQTLRAHQIPVCQRSRHELYQAHHILLADTFGELLSWMAHSELVIMGGSFAPKGGQSPLEPIRLGKQVLCGSDMRDFEQEIIALAPTGAIISVPTMDALMDEIFHQLKDPSRRHRHGEQGRIWLAEHSQHIVHDYLNALLDA